MLLEMQRKFEGRRIILGISEKFKQLHGKMSLLQVTIRSKVYDLLWAG